MADFTDRIKLIYDVSATGAKQGLAQVKSGVSEAEGAFGKLKAGAGGVLGQIGSAGPAAFAAIGAAAGAFVSNAIGKFTDLAFAAEQFSTAAGTSIEDASRWLEVAGDLGVEADAVQAAMGRLNREAASGKLAEFGITADNANDRLIQTLEYLASIPDEGARAKASFELLGKGAAAIGPLISNVGQLRDRLAEVKGGKLIDEADVSSAKQLRDNMDALADAWDDIVLSVGGSLAPLVSAVAGLAKAGADLAVAGEGKGGEPWWKELAGRALINTPAIKFLGDAIGLLGDEAEETADKVPAVSTALEAMTTETKAAEDALNGLNTAMLAQFNSQLRFEDAVGKSEEAMADYTEKLAASTAAAGGNAEANKATTKAANDAATAALAQAAAAVKLAEDQAAANGATLTAGERNAILRQNLQQVANMLAPGTPLRMHLEGYVATLGEIPPTTDTTVKLHGVEEAQRQLEALLRTINANPAIGVLFGRTAFPTAPGTAAVPSSSPTAGTRALMPAAAPTTNINVAVTVPPGAPTAEVGRYVADALVAHERRVGTQRRS